MFHNAFPKELNNDLQKVLRMLPQTSSNNISIKFSDDNIEYILNKYSVQFPYRLYLVEPDEEEISKLSETQKLMLFCMYTRSHDGYVREKYVKKILSIDFPNWCIPYIVKLCDEYVVEILEIIYERLNNRSNEDIQEFCRNNREQMRKSYTRMTSYWNEYYRGRKFHRYVGRMLFRECLGYSRLFEK